MKSRGLILEPETFALRGACFEVYKEKGCGFLESIYQACLAIEFQLQRIPFEPHPRLEIAYKGHLLPAHHQPDFICYQQIIVELKAVTILTDEHRAQIHNYLKATSHRVGLLVNFGHYPGIQIERVVH